MMCLSTLFEDLSFKVYFSIFNGLGVEYIKNMSLHHLPSPLNLENTFSSFYE